VDSSRFVARPLARLHARSVPPVQDYDRRIAVGIVSVPARGADEGRLVLAAPTVRGSTGAAGLRRVGRIDLDQASGLVSEHDIDLVPTYIEDGTIETALLRDIAAGRGDGSSHAGCHVLCTQPLDDHRAMPTADISRRGVCPMLADARLARPEFSNAAIGFGVARRAAFAATGNALSFADTLVQDINASRQGVARSVRQHHRHGYAAINAYGTGNGRAIFGQLAADTDLPFQSGARNCHLDDIAPNWPCVAELHPADLGKADARPAAVDLLHTDLASVERKGVAHALALELRIAALALPRPAECFVQRLQRALLRLLRYRAHEIHFGAKFRKLSRLRHVVEIVAGRSLKIAPVIEPLIQREVPHQTTDTSKLLEQDSLFGSWSERVSIASKLHIKLNALILLVRQLRKARVPMRTSFDPYELASLSALGLSPPMIAVAAVIRRDGQPLDEVAVAARQMVTHIKNTLQRGGLFARQRRTQRKA
jgi:hypothetical protein